MKDEERSFVSRLSDFASVAARDIAPIWISIVIITTLPYVIAMLRTPEGYVFSGVLTAYDDTFTYFAWMKQGADGHLLMCDPYTPEPQQCQFFLPLWYVLGFISRITHSSLQLVFHAARLFAALMMLGIARSITAAVIKSR